MPRWAEETGNDRERGSQSNRDLLALAPSAPSSSLHRAPFPMHGRGLSDPCLHLDSKRGFRSVSTTAGVLSPRGIGAQLLCRAPQTVVGKVRNRQTMNVPNSP